MSNNAGNISVGLVLNGADAFIGRVNKSAKSLDKYGRAVKTSTSHNDTFLHQMRDAAIILGLARSALENLSLLFTGLPRAIISQNAQLERAQILIAGMDTSAHSYSDALEDAKNTVNDLVNLSSSSPFSVQAITDSFAKLKAADIQNTTDALDSMVNAAAQAGANSEGLKRFTVAIQQMAGKGVLSMEELRQQAGEAVPQIMQLMANATAMRMDEMVKKISSGTVEAKSAINELVKEMTFAAMGSAEAMAQTLEGINNRIRNDFTMLAKEVGDSGFTETIKEIGNELDELLASPEAKAAAREFGDILSGVTRSLYDLSIAITENIKLIGTLVAILISSKVLGNASTGLSAIFKQAKLDAADYTASVDKFMTHTDRRISEVSRRIVSNQKAAVAATQSWVSRQTNVTTQQAAAWHRELEASMNKSHNAQIQKLQKLQKAYTSTGRQLWNVGKGIVNAMGGWTTAISVGIMGALYLMDEFIWKQKRAADEIIRTQGIGATAENITYAKKELEKLNEKLVVLKKIRNEINSGEREADGFELMHYNKQIKEIESRTKELNHAIEKGQSDMSAMAFDSGLSGSARLMYKELKEISATYKKEEKALREDLENQGLRGDAFEEAFKSRIEVLRQNAVNAARVAADAEKTALQDSIKKIQEGAENGVLSEQERRDIQYKKGLIEGLTETVEKYQDKVKTGTVKELSMNESKLASEESLLAKLKKTEALYVHRLARIKEEVKYGENRIRLEEDLASGKLKVADADLMALRAQADRSDAAVAGYKAEQESIKEIEEANKRLANLSLSLAKKLGTSQGKSLNEFMSWKTASEQNSEAIREMRAQLEAATKGSLSGAQEDGLSKLQAMAREIDLNNIIIQQREYQEEIALDLSTEMQRFGYETNKTKRGLEQVKRTLERKLTTLERNTEEYWRTKDAINSVNDSLELAARNADAINPKNDAWFDLGMSIKNMSNQVDDELAGAFEGVFDSIATSIVDTESSFSDMINNLADDLASFMIKMTMMQAVQSAFPSFFANGGIMSSEGSVPLKTYATGGIATSPQVAVFGEGSHNEAYVPLPDGKTIPVTMQGGGGSAPVVNVINQTGMQAETESNARFDGERWVTDVVLKAASRPGKFRDTMNRS